MLDIVQEKQNLKFLSWSYIRNSSGTAGSFLKSFSQLGNKKIYYKLSNFDKVKGIIGHECVNEIIVARLLTILGIPHLEYQLIHADIKIDNKVYKVHLCASEDFKTKSESKSALDVYYESSRLEDESSLEFCIRNGWEEAIYQMLVVDFIILNRDRHGANIEVLRNTKNRTLRLAPLFDHGLSLLFSCQSEEAIKNYDVSEDKSVNNFLGSRSAYENLRLIPKDKLPVLNPLSENDKTTLLNGLDGIIPPLLQEKIWQMIWERWCIYENFCNS